MGTTSALAAILLLGAGGAWQDGSLIVLQNSNKPVASFTHSDITHVALLYNLSEEPWVYEAVPGKVRRTPLARYAEEIARLNGNRSKQTRVWLLQPSRPYSAAEREALHGYLERQVGRRYSIKGYLRGQSGDGLHCAQYCSTALSKTGRYEFGPRQTLSPSAVLNAVRDSHDSPQRIGLRGPIARKAWDERLWNSMAALQIWMSWASYEVWTLCW